MIRGMFDKDGRAFVEIVLVAPHDKREQQLQGWVDTGFTGEIVVSQRLADDFGLESSGAVTAELGDGNEVLLPTYTCRVRWLSEIWSVEAIASSSEIPLIGVGLLRGRRLVVDFAKGEVTVE